MNCTWEQKSHKLCTGNCEEGCDRKRNQENTDPLASLNAWRKVISKIGNPRGNCDKTKDNS